MTAYIVGWDRNLGQWTVARDTGTSTRPNMLRGAVHFDGFEVRDGATVEGLRFREGSSVWGASLRIVGVLARSGAVAVFTGDQGDTT